MLQMQIYKGNSAWPELLPIHQKVKLWDFSRYVISVLWLCCQLTKMCTYTTDSDLADSSVYIHFKHFFFRFYSQKRNQNDFLKHIHHVIGLCLSRPNYGIIYIYKNVFSFLSESVCLEKCFVSGVDN